MDTRDLVENYELNSKKTISIFNPLDRDFEVNFDGKPLPVAKKLSFTDYPYHQGLHVKKHLIQAVVNHRGIKPLDHKAIKEIEKEVYDQ